METRNYVKLWLLALVVGAVLLSCRKDLNSISTSQWQPVLAAPFVQSNITMRNIIGNDSNLYTNPDSLLIYLHFKDSVFHLNSDSVLQIRDEIIYEQKHTLGPIKVDEELLNELFRLEEMLAYIDEDIADSLTKYDGTMQYFPPFQMLDSARQTFKPSADYEYLTFSNGYLVISITNTMPLTFQNINIKIEDIDYGQLLKNIQIAPLMPQQTYADSIYLNGLTVGNEFAIIDVTSFYTEGSFPEKVLIDLQQGFSFDLAIRRGEVIAGRAKIDDQILEADTSMIQYDPRHDEKLFHITFREGDLNYDIQSGLPMDAIINVKFPSALKNAEVPEDNFVLKSQETVSESTTIKGLSIDFTTDPSQPYNQFPVEFIITLPPTDYMITFDSSDFVTSKYVFDTIKLAYADGYFGKREINVAPDTITSDIKFLDQLKGTIILTEPVITIVDFISIRPDMIVYNGGGFTNWNDVGFNFVYDTALFTGHAETKIPLILKSIFFAFSDKVNLGVRLNINQGMSNIQTEKHDLGLLTSENSSSVYNVYAKTDYQVNTSGLSGDFGMSDYFFNMQNLGLSFDIGADWDISESFAVNLSVLDLGFISWNSRLKNYQNKYDSINFSGIYADINDENFDVSQAYSDTLQELFDVIETESKYTAGLPTRLIVGGEYYFGDRANRVSLLFSRRFIKNYFNMSITAGYDMKVSDHFAFKATYTICVIHLSTLGLVWWLILDRFRFMC